MFLRTSACGLCCLILLGCGTSNSKPPAKEGIIGKTTQDIGKADAESKKNASDSKVHVTDPITGPLQAYGPMVEQISKIEIDHAVNLFHGLEGRYPKDYDEFMARIIKENNIKLPVLPFGGKYQYDEATHSLLVVRTPENAAKAAGK